MAKGPSQNLFKRALVVLLAFTIIGFGATGYGLINTIIIHGEEYAKKAEQQQLQDIVTKAKRSSSIAFNGVVCSSMIVTFC